MRILLSLPGKTGSLMEQPGAPATTGIVTQMEKIESNHHRPKEELLYGRSKMQIKPVPCLLGQWWALREKPTKPPLQPVTSKGSKFSTLLVLKMLPNKIQDTPLLFSFSFIVQYGTQVR